MTTRYQARKKRVEQGLCLAHISVYHYESALRLEGTEANALPPNN